MKNYFPILDWAKSYNKLTLTNDLIAAVIVTIMLIPQSLAYALLAGLPPEVGLYASILPLIAYAIFGTSRTLAVGPVAVVSLMTATALGGLGLANTTDYIAYILHCPASHISTLRQAKPPPRANTAMRIYSLSYQNEY